MGRRGASGLRGVREGSLEEVVADLSWKDKWKLAEAFQRGPGRSNGVQSGVGDRALSPPQSLTAQGDRSCGHEAQGAARGHARSHHEAGFIPRARGPRGGASAGRCMLGKRLERAPLAAWVPPCFSLQLSAPLSFPGHCRVEGVSQCH